jgi:hypothetical protein
MRLLAVILAALAIGCGPRQHLVVPPTPEGFACLRQCEQIYWACVPTCTIDFPRDAIAQGFCEGWRCSGARDNCATTCPGAYWVQEQ